MGRVHFTKATHCTAADESRCTRCAFWHAPTASGDACATHAVWWVILIAVLAALGVVAAACAGVVLAVNAAVRHIRLRWHRGAVSLFKMARSDVPFVPTRHDDVVVSTNTVVFADGALPVGVESKMLLYVRNAGRSPTKVQFVAKERGDKFAVRTEPSVVTLSRGMACEFEVFLTSLCSCKVNDKAPLLSGSAARPRAQPSRSVSRRRRN